MTVEIHDRWESLPGDLLRSWSSLVASGGYNPSLHPGWLDATVRSWGLAPMTRVAVVRDGEAWAIIPFLVRPGRVMGLPMRCLELPTNVVSYHAEIVSTGDLSGLLGRFLADRRLPPWDAFRVVNLPVGGNTARAIRSLNKPSACGLSVRAAEQSPYAPIDRDWTAYLATRAKKVRSNVSRSQRMMRDAGESGMSWYTAGSDTRQLLAEMLEIESQSWKANAGAAILADTPQCRYYEHLLPWLAAHEALLANVLLVQNRPCAYTLCASWNGWIGQLKTSFVQELRDAGSRVIHSSLERAFQTSGAREYDFLGDNAPHKRRWADLLRAHEDLWVFACHLRGRTLALLKSIADRRYERQLLQRAAAASAPEQSEE